MNNIILQKSIEDLYNNTNDNIIGVSYGQKKINNFATSDLSVSFMVREKKPISQLSQSELLPSSVNIDGITIQTDVVENRNLFSIHSCYDWPSQSNINNRHIHRPLIGGISIGADDINGAGTLGSVCVDNIDGSLVGLSNNHVLVGNRNGFINSDRDSDNNSNILNKNIIQPGKIDNNYQNNIIGISKRYFPLYKNRTNYVDAAIVSLYPNTVNSNSFNQLNVPYNISGFASTEEINSLLLKILYKSGRTTGSIGGVDCPVVVSNIFASSMITGYIGSDSPLDFGDLIIFSYAAKDTYNRPVAGVCVPGDSGSTIIAEFNGEYKIVGLVFAAGTLSNPDGAPESSPLYNVGVACRIDRVVDKLNLVFNNNQLSYSNSNNWSYHRYEEYSDQGVITIDNETYWQIGR
jgi:hypothetical protein